MFCGRPRKFFTRSFADIEPPGSSTTAAIPHGCVASQQIVVVELQEEIFGDHFVPEIGVVGGGVAAEMAEGGPHVSFGQRREEGVVAVVVEGDCVEIDVLGLGFVDVVGDGA